MSNLTGSVWILIFEYPLTSCILVTKLSSPLLKLTFIWLFGYPIPTLLLFTSLALSGVIVTSLPDPTESEPELKNESDLESVLETGTGSELTILFLL